MKTQPINNISFKKLYISKEDYNDSQKEAISDIENKLTAEHIRNLEESGYDVFVNGDAYVEDKVHVIAGLSGNSEGIIVGSYGKNFDVNDVYNAVNEKATKNKKIRETGWALIGTAWGILIATLFAVGVKGCFSRAEKPAVQKAATEIVDTLKQVK